MTYFTDEETRILPSSHGFDVHSHFKNGMIHNQNHYLAMSTIRREVAIYECTTI